MLQRSNASDAIQSASGLNPACMLCGSRDIIRLWEGTDKKFRGPGRFAYVTCRGCGLVFLHPRPPAQEVSRYYPDHVTPVLANSAASPLRMKQRLKRMVAEDWYGYADDACAALSLPVGFFRKILTFPLRPLLSQIPQHRPGGRVLDIGCGSGGYLAFLASLAWACDGIEPGLKSRAYAQERLGLTVHPGPLESCGFPDSFFDVVTMWHVIEHLPDPLSTLVEIH